MANMCFSSVTISGKKSTLEKISKKISDAPQSKGDSPGSRLYTQSFDYILNKPLSEQPLYQDTYGTKYWDVEEEAVIEKFNDKYSIELNGNSPWFSPDEFLQELSEIYKVEVELEYNEEDNNNGEIYWVNGKEKFSDTYELDEDGERI
jgi:hypothetical protein